MSPAPTDWLLTGVTGFVGKVLLADLLRRQRALGVRRIRVVIRARGSRSAHERFRNEVANAACFAGLHANWTDLVDVLEADLRTPGLGLPDAAGSLADVTHIVHAAASVAFDLPGAAAAEANITPAVALMDLARALPRLQRFVYVSTAYVTPHRRDDHPIPEALVPLPQPAAALYESLRGGKTRDDHILAATGHPNTYTLTKCLAEHLLAEQRGQVPLSIVRPSIVSASRRYPFPGWIDSVAGFGAFAVLVGLGHLRAVVGRPDARLDVVPVDDVTSRIIHAATREREPFRIRHAAVGLAGASTVAECWNVLESWFRLHPIARRPRRAFLGSSRIGYRLADLWHHRLPMALTGLRSAAARRQASKLGSRMDYLNSVFPYFTTRSFRFECSWPVPPSRLGAPYLRTVCRGLYRHVLKQDEREWTLAGAAHGGHDGDLRWVLSLPRGNGWVRAASWLVTKVLRRTSHRVTVDLTSLERARAAMPGDAALVIVPSHRSYLDFVLVSYLAFARPDLGVAIPHIAATMEFGRIPILGRLLSALHAFYLTRGQGREDPTLTRRVQQLLAEGKCLEFFVEGARSRTREFLPPKRGLLRALQASGRRIAILPIAISYDRVPEEATFARELAGEAKPPMRLSSLLRWAWDAWRGRVALGRVHLAAGQPVLMDQGSDVPAVAEAIIAELEGAMAVSSYHLEAYCQEHPVSHHDAASLQRLLEAKGHRVLASPLDANHRPPAVIATTFLAHFRDRCPELFGQSPSSRKRAANAPRPLTSNFL